MTKTGRPDGEQVARWGGALALALALCGCRVDRVKNGEPVAPAVASTVSYASIDTELGEHLYPEEKPIADELSGMIENSIRKQYSAGSARRDAHPKAHGCVKAEIHILDTVPVPLAKGMFIPGKTYQAWIRFSNGSGDPTHADIKRDARGMAIKVLGVPGKKVLEDPDAAAQDFIMINHPVFFATDPARYLAFVVDGGSEHFYRKLLIPFDLGARGTLIALETRSSRISNPLQVRYWSMVLSITHILSSEDSIARVQRD